MILYIAVVIALAGSAGSQGASRFSAHAGAFATTVLIAFMIDWLYATDGAIGSGLKSMITGADGRASTSKTQYLLWTLAIGYALCYIGAFAMLEAGTPGEFLCSKGENPARDCVVSTAWPHYLLLLGFPVTAAAAAKGITVSKMNRGTLQKTKKELRNGGTVRELAGDDRGNADIADLQYLVFNLFALAYVGAVLFTTGVLGPVPEILLGLTGVSAGAYVLNKSAQANAPRVTSVAPEVIRPGTRVRIRGVNLFPAGYEATPDLQVKIGGIEATEDLKCHAHKNLITVVAPSGMTSKVPEVRVTTAAGLETDGYDVVVETELNIIGFAPAQVTAGRRVRIYTSGLGARSNPRRVQVNFDDRTTSVMRVRRGNVLVVSVPADIDPGRAKVVVRQDGRVSREKMLTIARSS